MKILSILCYIIAGAVLLVGSAVADEDLNPKQKLFMRGCYLILQAAEDPTLGDGIAGDKYDFAMFMYATGIMDTVRDTLTLYDPKLVENESEEVTKARRAVLVMSNKEWAEVIIQTVNNSLEALEDPPSTMVPTIISLFSEIIYEHQVEPKK